MYIDLEPGDYVTNPANEDWGIGQIQSIIGNKVTVNFENFGKQVLNIDKVNLKKSTMNKNELKILAENLIDTFHLAGQKSIELYDKGLRLVLKKINHQ